jgi:hypothetical protein
MSKLNDIQQHHWPELWQSFRFESIECINKALDKALSRDLKIKYPSDLLRGDKANIGKILTYYRNMRIVTEELKALNILNWKAIKANMDYGHDVEFNYFRFPCIFHKCSQCGGFVDNMIYDGMWFCKNCGNMHISGFFDRGSEWFQTYPEEEGKLAFNDIKSILKKRTADKPGDWSELPF